MNTCFECGNQATINHHVVPRSKGGTKTIPLCADCHSKIHKIKSVHVSTLTKEAMQRKKAQGQRVGNIAFGFQLAADGIHLELNNAEQNIIRFSNELHTQGATLSAICAALTAEGLTARNGKPFNAQQVKRLLSNYENKWKARRERISA